MRSSCSILPGSKLRMTTIGSFILTKAPKEIRTPIFWGFEKLKLMSPAHQ
jgi:hypothetical protein